MPRAGTKRLEFNGPFRGIMELPPGQIVPDGFLSDCKNFVNIGGSLKLRFGLLDTDGWTPDGGASLNGWPGTFGNAVTMHVIRYTDEPDIIVFQVHDNGLVSGSTGGFQGYVIGRPRGGGINAQWMTLQADINDAGKWAHRRWRATYIQPDDWTLVARGDFGGANQVNGVKAFKVKVDPDSGQHAIDQGLLERSAGGPPNIGATITVIFQGSGGANEMEQGAYEYAITTFDTVTFRESPPELSFAGLREALSPGMALRISMPGASLAPNMKYRVYRRRVGNTVIDAGASTQRGDGVGAQDFYYFLSEFGIPTSGDFANNYAGFSVPPSFSDFTGPGGEPILFIDGLSNSKVGPETAPFNNLPPPVGTQYMAYHRGRAFYVVLNSNIIWFSEPINQRTGVSGAEYVGPNSFFEIPSDGNNSITGLWSFGRNLVVFTDSQVFVVNTDTIDTGFPIIEELESAGGCSSYWTIQELPPATSKSGLLIYAGTNGIYAFDGASTRNIGDAVQRTLDKTIRAASVLHDGWYNASAVVDVRDRLYIINVQLSGEVRPGHTTLVYSIDTDSWTKYDVNGFWSAASVRERRAPEDFADHRNISGIYLASAKNSTSDILRFGDPDVLPTNLDAEVGSTGPIFTPFQWSADIPNRMFGSSAAQKHIQDLAVRFSRNVVASTVWVFVSSDTDVPPLGSWWDTHDMSNETLAQFHIGIPSYYVGFKLLGDSTLAPATSRIAMLGYMIDYQIRGYRD